MTTVSEHLPERERVVIAHIIRSVQAVTGVSAELMERRLRTARASRARHLAMALIREATPLSLAEIGGLFGGRGHDTVIHAIKVIDRMKSTDPETARDYKEILRTIEERHRFQSPTTTH